MLKQLWSSDKLRWRLARVLLLVAAGLVILIMAFEDKLIYFPARYPEGFWAIDSRPAPEGEIVPQIEDCQFTAEDGVKLHGWYCSPQRKAKNAMEPVPAQMTLLWFHGNAGNISHRYEMLSMLVKIPVNIFIIDYRGYGKSEGTPSEQGLYRDASAAWDYLVRQRNVPPERIVVFGKSLGGAVAIDLATKVEPAGLIVQSSFTSVSDMARSVVPFLPSVLLRTRMDSINKVGRIRSRKLFIHSPADEVVPYKLGRRLFEAAPEPKQFLEIKDAGHNETYLVGGRAYLDALRGFIESCGPSGRN